MDNDFDQNKSIHLVLNDANLENQITKFLRDYASNIKTSNHINKFLKQPLSHAPACLITSFDSSEPGGLGFIKRVQSNGLSIPVMVIATDNDNVYSAVKAFQAGAADYIQQPIDKKDFIDRLDKILNSQK